MLFLQQQEMPVGLKVLVGHNRKLKEEDEFLSPKTNFWVLIKLY